MSSQRPSSIFSISEGSFPRGKPRTAWSGSDSRKAFYPELLQQNDPVGVVLRNLKKALRTAGPKDLFVATSGMNAVYAAFRACAELQARRGRTIWLQIGWLYLDTIAILKKFTTTSEEYLYLGKVFDTAAVEKLIAVKGSKIAGVITELPTNP